MDGEHNFTPVDPIGHDAAEDEEAQQHHHAQRTEQAEIQRRRGQIEEQPALRDALHPGTDVGNEIARPEPEIVGIAERAKRSGTSEKLQKIDSNAKIFFELLYSSHFEAIQTSREHPGS